MWVCWVSFFFNIMVTQHVYLLNLFIFILVLFLYIISYIVCLSSFFVLQYKRIFLFFFCFCIYLVPFFPRLYSLYILISSSSSPPPFLFIKMFLLLLFSLFIPFPSFHLSFISLFSIIVLHFATIFTSLFITYPLLSSFPSCPLFPYLPPSLYLLIIIPYLLVSFLPFLLLPFISPFFYLFPLRAPLFQYPYVMSHSYTSVFPLFPLVSPYLILFVL